MCYVLVVGSRVFNDYDLLKKSLDEILLNQNSITIVSGGAKGADSLAEQYATEKGYECLIFRADWKRYGKGAGLKRNKQMHQFIAQYQDRCCIAFWDGQSKGTHSNFKMAEEYKNLLHIIRY